MTSDTFEDFAATLTPSGPILGLDLGTHTLGVAISDG